MCSDNIIAKIIRKLQQQIAIVFKKVTIVVEQRWLQEGGAKPRVEGANGAALGRRWPIRS